MKLILSEPHDEERWDAAAPAGGMGRWHPSPQQSGAGTSLRTLLRLLALAHCIGAFSQFAVAQEPVKPDAPVVTVTPGDASLSVSFSRPRNAKKPTHYHVRWRQKDSADWKPNSAGMPFAVAATTRGGTIPPEQAVYDDYFGSATRTPLVNGTTYEVQVRARNIGETGLPYSDWSASAEGTPVREQTSTPTVSFSVNSARASEGSSFNVQVAISPPLSEASSVRVQTLSSRTTAALTNDYTISGLTSGRLTLPEDASSASFTVSLVRDGSPDGANGELLDERITLRLSEVNNAPYVVDSNSRQFVLHITDTDNTPDPAPGNSRDATLSGLSVQSSSQTSSNFSRLNLTPSFSSGRLAYKATVVDPIAYARVRPTTEHSAATVGVGKDRANLESVSRGSFSSSVALEIGANRIWVSVLAEDGVTSNDYRINITRLPTVRLSASPNPVTEGSSVTVTATLSAALSSDVTIPVTLTDGTAESDDHGTLASIPISSGSTTGTGTITTAQDDDTADETFTVALGTLPASVAAGSPNSVQVTIADDDSTLPRVSLSASPNPVTEGGAVTVTVTLSAALSSDVTIPVWLVPDTAELDDYGTLSSITISSGSTTGTGTITTAQDDDTDDELFAVVLGEMPSSLRTSAEPISVFVGITDDDAALEDETTETPTVSLSAEPNPVTEGDSVTVTATLSRALPSKVLIPVTLTDGTAEPDDHGELARFAIRSGQTTGTGTITTAQDDDADDETFTVALGTLPASVAAGSPDSVQVTISDDDDATAEKLPQGPLQLALWTDQVAYRPNEPLRLFRTLEPHRLRDEQSVLFFRQCVNCDESSKLGKPRYLAPLSGSDKLRGSPVDQFGLPEGSFRISPLASVARELTYQGPAPEEPGLWQFVMELRAKRGAVKRMWAKFVVGPGQLLTRRGFERILTEDLTLPSGRVHYLLDRMVVRAGATLRLEAGALVQALGERAEIVVEPGGVIEAAGTRQEPVVLTCMQPPGQRQPGCWGGLRVLGRAPVTGAAEEASYGGSDWADSSGSLRFVRIEFAGASRVQGAAKPALALFGVGSGTVLEHVQVRSSSGPGVAFIGGAVGCDYCVASACEASGVTWERGWRGRLRHLYVWQGHGRGDAIDGRNLAAGPDREPRSHPALANVTLASGGPRALMSKGCGLRLQDGTGLTAQRLLVCGFRAGAVVVGPRAGQLFEDGVSSVTDSIQWENLRPPQGWSGAGVEFLPDRSPRLRNAGTDANHDPRPRRLLTARGPPDDSDYVGAFGEQNWLEEWTVFGREQDYAP